MTFLIDKTFGFVSYRLVFNDTLIFTNEHPVPILYPFRPVLSHIHRIMHAFTPWFTTKFSFI